MRPSSFQHYKNKKIPLKNSAGVPDIAFLFTFPAHGSLLHLTV
jgi:hypothetical protein